MKNKKNSFTLVEVLVAVTIFVSVTVIALLAFTYAIRMQRENLAHQELLDQISYMMEHMSRAIRMAKVQTTSPPFCVPVGTVYESIAPNDNIAFLQYRYNPETDEIDLFCTRFFLAGTELREDIPAYGPPANPFLLSSPFLEVTDFNVQLSGTSPELVQIYLKVRDKNDPKIEIELQTSISQRDIQGP